MRLRKGSVRKCSRKKRKGKTGREESLRKYRRK